MSAKLEELQVRVSRGGGQVDVDRVVRALADARGDGGKDVSLDVAEEERLRERRGVFSSRTPYCRGGASGWPNFFVVHRIAARCPLAAARGPAAARQAGPPFFLALIAAARQAGPARVHANSFELWRCHWNCANTP